MSTQAAYHFFPFQFVNWPHTANNLLVVMATTVLYFSLCVVLILKQVRSTGSGRAFIS